MRACTCFLLLRIFGSYFTYTHSVTPNSPKDNKRSVNLALETVLEFNEKDKASDIKFLDNVQNFITKVKTVIGKNNNGKPDFRRDFKTTTVDTFTGFIQEVVNILATFDNKTFTDFIEILDDEIRKYHYRGCKFYELTENNEIRKLIAEKLDWMRKTPAFVIKANIDALPETLKYLNYDKHVKEFLDYVNSLYRQDARGKFQKVLTELELHGKVNPRSAARLREIVKNGVRLIIFDHYTNLNTNVRRDVKQKMETFWKHFYDNSPSMRNSPNAKNSENIMKNVKKPRRQASQAKVKNNNYKNGGTKQGDVKRDSKQTKLTKKDTKNRPSKVQKKGRKVPSPKIKPQEQSDSFASESLEVYHQSKEEPPQKKTTISDKILKKTLKNSRKKTERIEDMNLGMRSPTLKKIPNIWIEESTGRLPKAVLEKLSIKAKGLPATKAAIKSGPNRNKKYNKGQKRWHGKMYEPKDDTKRPSKFESREGSRKDSDENKKLKTFRSSKSFIMKQHQYKKSMGPTNVDINETDRSSREATKRLKYLDVVDVLKLTAKSGEKIKRFQGTADAKELASPPKLKIMKYDEILQIKVTPRTLTYLEPRKQLPKKKKMLSRKFESQVASLEHPSLSSISVEKMEINTDKKSEHQSQQKEASLENQLYVIRKIKKLEKDIEEVKSKINDRAEVKLSEPKENKENQLPETTTESDVKNDPKIGNLKAPATLDNKTQLIHINKDFDKVISESDDGKLKNENGKRNNNIGPIFKANSGPVINRSFSASIPGQYKVEMTESTISKTPLVTKNTYVHNLVSKYKKIMENFEKGKIKKKVDAGLGKVKNNISDFAVKGTTKAKKDVLIDSVISIIDKDSNKNDKIDDGVLNMTKTANNKKEVLNKFVSVKNFEGNRDKKSESVFRSEGNVIPNVKDTAEVAKVTRITNKEIADNEIKNNVDNVIHRQVKAKPFDDSFTTPQVEPHIKDSKVSDVQDRTEKTKNFDITNNTMVKYEKNKNSNTKPKSIATDFQSIIVTKEPNMKGDKKTVVTLNSGSVTPKAKPGEAGIIKHRAFDDVTDGAETKTRDIQSTSTSTTVTESTTSAATTEVTSTTTLKLSTIQTVLPRVTSSEPQTSLKYETPLLI